MVQTFHGSLLLRWCVPHRAPLPSTQHEDMGCTATAVYVWCVGTERFLQCANVGDSTAFLSRNGTAVPLQTVPAIELRR